MVSNVIYVNIYELYSDADLNKFRGKLGGKIVLTAPKRKLELQFNPLAVRLSDEDLESMAELKVGGIEGGRRRQRESDDEDRPLSQEEVELFFEAEGVAALIEPGARGRNSHFDKGVVSVGSGRPIGKGDRKPLPRLIIAAEHYNRMMRILEKGIDVEMEVNVKIEYDEKDLVDYNVIAGIPGTDLRDEVVMIGGHYDAKSFWTGATDNASGAAAVMEAMRILKETGTQPRRTIRAALWGSEEAGLLGARAYVRDTFGGSDHESRKPEHDKLSVYLNMGWYGRGVSTCRGMTLFVRSLKRG